MSAVEVEAILERKHLIEAALSRIPPTASLADESEVPWDALDELYAAVDGIPGVGLAKATKFLHKKRPHLVPMLDSFVVGYLISVDRSVVRTSATGLTRSYQVDLIENRTTLERVQHEIRGRGYELTLCRILDLFTWAYAGTTLPSWAEDVAGLIVRGDRPLQSGIAADAAELAAELDLELDPEGRRMLEAAIDAVGFVAARRVVGAWVRETVGHSRE